MATLEHLKDCKVNPKRTNVGHGVWRSIEINPKGKVHSQIVVEEKGCDESLEDQRTENMCKNLMKTRGIVKSTSFTVSFYSTH